MAKMFSYLHLPYFPNRQHKKKLGRPTPYKYLQRIAYTKTWRGLDDEHTVLLFYGASFELLKDTCEYVFRLMDGRVQNLVIDREHSCRVRNGKCYRRTMIKIVGLDEQFISMDNFTMLLIYRMQTICNCTIKHYRLETFLNL